MFSQKRKKKKKKILQTQKSYFVDLKTIYCISHHSYVFKNICKFLFFLYNFVVSLLDKEIVCRLLITRP